MREFIDYYIKFLRYFWENIKEFFRLIGKAFSNVFYHNIVKHFNLLNELSNRFRPLDWVFTILVMTINIAFILFLLIRLIQLLRRYLKFNKMEVTKEKLLDEITLLSQKVVDVTNEKNQILTLKMENLGLYTKKLEKEKKDPKEKIPSRFTKLIEVDEAYDRSPYLAVMDEGDLLSLKELVTRFVNFSASELKLYYEEETIRAFFAGMATSKIIILEGISGTGKTSLPYAMGRFFNNPADIISVQPSWRDRSEMIGYLNEFTKRFNESDFLKALYEATYRDDLNFIVLDELNLARIEYYFAEFLSIMEMPNPSDWQIEVAPSSELGDPLHLINGKILVAPNIWFIGTANKDDSTFTITDKVYDRASVIEMDARIDKIDAPYGESVNM
ncbi:MAG: hypothetical protein PHY22_03490, partial [Acholeplasmataceae bacterium]|nr:hypothetical protein [Acholeplasmataceae bacterium]